MTAVTVRMDELPDAMETGVAMILTVGGGIGTTITVVVAKTLPPAPVADAV